MFRFRSGSVSSRHATLAYTVIASALWARPIGKLFRIGFLRFSEILPGYRRCRGTCYAIRAIARTRPASVSGVRRLAADQKRIWSFPLTATRGNEWKSALGVIGATTALIALDPIFYSRSKLPWLQTTGPRSTATVRRFNQVLSGRNTALAINSVPVSSQIYGSICGNSYARQTGSLANEAAANAQKRRDADETRRSSHGPRRCRTRG